ncbi:phosphatidate cytidylyltransferase [Aurantimonas endophytica]|uniref:Phosphatidate cytidylyltransferase n=1 Tax=Aurantimonas endophytica TaxID=1522175 RepID=A0A7W6MN28_9HYPH|nr:phosphatidate cytidylyltransferase [Aurantimonas endophytica]MBB4001475.1 phosphatidate cytidylyltransferase [Aurantimonas endophytica]MCO6402884.1 CDP-archaeol synthase [Aurantimonas endophytica]
MGLGLRRLLAAPTWTDLRSRLISAIVLGLLVLALTMLGGWPFRLLCGATGVIVFEEWSRMTRAKQAGPIFRFARRTLYLSLIAFIFGFDLAAIAIVAGGAAFISYVDRGERKADWVLGGLFYAAVASLPPGMLRGDDAAGLAALGLIIAVVWPTDIFAYFTGRSIGGPKLMPRVSPKKTISGALGGLVAGVVFGVLFAEWVAGSAGLFIVVLAALLSIFGQAGDLYESWIKRRFGVKDSGRLIPGHGGLMDRIDGLIIATAVAWLVGLLLAGFDHPARGIFPL